jgi:hypothetical protein
MTKPTVGGVAAPPLVPPTQRVGSKLARDVVLACVEQVAGGEFGKLNSSVDTVD